MFDTYIVTNSHISTDKLEKLKAHKLPIIFADNQTAYYDEVGGFHWEAIGWNPKGGYCGECTSLSCKDCSNRNISDTYFGEVRKNNAKN